LCRVSSLSSLRLASDWGTMTVFVRSRRQIISSPERPDHYEAGPYYGMSTLPESG
jgi:hypothetical protein